MPDEGMMANAAGTASNLYAPPLPRPLQWGYFGQKNKHLYVYCPVHKSCVAVIKFNTSGGVLEVGFGRNFVPKSFITAGLGPVLGLFWGGSGGLLGRHGTLDNPRHTRISKSRKIRPGSAREVPNLRKSCPGTPGKPKSLNPCKSRWLRSVTDICSGGEMVR